MSGPGRHEKPSGARSRGLAARVGLALAVLIGGYVGTTASLANVVQRLDPASASALASGNGLIQAKLAKAEFSRAPAAAENSAAAARARKALLREPTAVDALTVLGFQAEISGNLKARDRTFAYATRLTRRELQPQIWAIEAAVTRGDIAGALEQYDKALRTSREARTLLFPTLAAALAEPKVRSRVIDLLAKRPSWGEPFVVFAADNPATPLASLAFFTDARRINLPVSDDLHVALINHLVAKQNFSEAWGYYTSVRRGSRRDQSRDPMFNLTGDIRSAFDWRPGTDEGVYANILASGQGGALEFALSPGSSGMIVRQTQMLSPGAYRLFGTGAVIERTAASLLYWTLQCVDGRETGEVTVRPRADGAARFAGRFIVPQGCPVQTLMLVGRAGDGMSGVAGRIEEAKLELANGR